MRPTKLVIQGLTAYKQPVEIDFSDLDLFAITGPTGAGKSSLVDAITYALFGQAPRVGRNVRELISQGDDRLKVSLEFATNGSTYRIHRSSSRKGQGTVQLERADPSAEDGWARIADRVTEATQEIEAALHMDYEAFVRSVLLPQGQFQEFLAGDRDERRKVLDGLLRLGVYSQMQQRANAIAAGQAADADRLRERLDTELRDATPEALAAAKKCLAELKAAADGASRAREALDTAGHMAEAISQAREQERAASDALDETARRLTEAKALLAGGEETLKTLDEQIAAARAEITEAAYDSDLHLRLTGCLPLLRQAEQAAAREAKLAAEIKKATALVTGQIEKARAAKARYEAAAAEAGKAQAAFDEARHGNAAALLQSTLKAGDPCPVCGQKVGHIEVHKVAALDKVRAEAEAAKKAEETASLAVRDVETALAKSQQALEGYETQLSDAQAEHEQRAADLAAMLPEPGLQTAEVERRIEALEAARKRQEALAGQEKDLLGKREAQERAIAGARKDATALEAEAKAREKEAAAAGAEAAKAGAALASAAKEMGWDDVTDALGSGRDALPLLRTRLEEARADEGHLREQIGGQTARIEQIEKEIGQAKELRKQEKAAREAATLARDLASLLRVDSFPSFIRERALQTLAREGSRQLEAISGGRYDFEVEGQDFLIVDRWNGAETRSVKTLSGGETFLASLALALALAEHLPSIAGGAESALESLFIDEGFSHLDAETLDVVASALEVLGQDRRRLIGVVTHVPALAERMPARITVHKSQAGSTVSVD